MTRRCGGQEVNQRAGKTVAFKALQESGNLAVGGFRGDREADGIHVRNDCLNFEEYRSRFGIFDSWSGWPLRPGGLLILRTGHDEKHKKPEPNQHDENHDEGVNAGTFAFFIRIRLITHDDVPRGPWRGSASWLHPTIDPFPQTRGLQLHGRTRLLGLR